MSCPDVEPRVALYAGGELDEALAGEVEGHVTACGSCRALLLALREQREAMVGSSAAAPTQDQLDDMRHGVLAAIARGDAGRSILDSFRFAPFRPLAWGLGGLAAAALVALAVWVTVPGPQEVPAGQPAAARDRVPNQAVVVPVPRTPDAKAVPVERRAEARRVAPATSSRSEGAAARPPLAWPRREATATSVAGVSLASDARETAAEGRTAAELLDAPAGPVRRIEFQTADPNIRIIWLLHEQAPDPNRSGAHGR